MIAYALQRLVQAVVVILLVTLIVFFMVFLSGDPVVLMLPPETTREDIERFRRQMGYDDPALVQYARFLSGLVRGDLGESLRLHQPALGLVAERGVATFELAAAAMLVALGIAIPTGVISAIRRGSVYDLGFMMLAMLGQSLPTFWLGIMLILAFSVKLGWLPTSGRGGLEHLVLPAITLGTFYSGRVARLTRSVMLDQLGEDYVRTARAKGLREWAIVIRHALKNASLPIVTVVGLEIGAVLSGAVITETIFAWPGIGSLAIQAVLARDYPLVQAIVVVVALVFILLNFLVDVLYAYLDPRIRLFGTSGVGGSSAT
jgi:ABC-type dipeptide/oligopeptide/nickel transport system permease component